MPYSIRPQPLAEITTLEQVIASARNRLDGLADDDPATRLLHEHLAELIAKRETLLRTLEDRTYASNKISMRILPFVDLLGIYMLIVALINLAEGHIGDGVTTLIIAVIWLAWMLSATVWTWRDVREYRRTHPGLLPGSFESGSGGP